MPIKYSLQPNKTIGAKPGEYRAVVKPVDTLYLDDLVERLHKRHNNITPITANMVLGAFFETVEESLVAGNHICTPVFNARIGVKGSFNGEKDQFYENRHHVTFNCSTNKSLKKIAARQRAYKIESNSINAVITRVIDLKRESKNNLLTPGGILEIKGRYLRLDPDKPDEMIGLRQGSQLYPIEQVFTRSENHLMITIPDHLPQGHYELIIKNRVRNASELRLYSFPHRLELVRE